MKRLVRPDHGWPWEQPGYRFSIGWPAGYELDAAAPEKGALTKAELQAISGLKGGAGLARAQLTGEMRAGQLGDIKTGRGTVSGIAKQSQQDLDKCARTRRGAL